MQHLWQIERRLWLDGVEAFEQYMARECLMVFAPMGIMTHDTILEGLRHAPRWSELEMKQQTTSEPSPGLRILAYRADARREGAAAYGALCSSTYVETDGGSWRLVQHQHTPV